MKLLTLPFSVDPSSCTASYILKNRLNPLSTLVIFPTERSKTFFAFHILEQTGKDCIAPFMITGNTLIKSLASLGGMPVAGDVERLCILFRALMDTPGAGRLLPLEKLKIFPDYLSVSRRILGTIDELGREEISLDDETLKNLKESSKWAENYLPILSDLIRIYSRYLKDLSLCDPALILKSIRKEEILSFFSPYDNVLLVSPLSLTAFEKRVFEVIDKKLTVINQETADYDFSAVTAFRGGAFYEEKEMRPSIRLLESSSRMDQVMQCLGIILAELKRKVKPREIAVVNLDPLFSEMLYNSLRAIGVEVNYSEGLEVRKSPIFQLLLQARLFFKSNLDSRVFLEMIGSEIFAQLTGSSLQDHRGFILRMRKEIIRRRIFNFTSLDALFTMASSFFNESGSGVGGFREAISLLNELFFSKSFKELYLSLNALFKRLEGKKIYEFYAVRNLLLDLAMELFDLGLFFEQSPFEIYLNWADTRRYPVLGSYLEGIQILGLLETRGISFRVVIVPSFNEGFFPVHRTNDLFLPTIVRRAMGLPSFLEREELEFYYLKRLVDCSDTAYICSIDDPAGEIDVRSRFAIVFENQKAGKIKHTECRSAFNYFLSPESEVGEYQKTVVSNPSIPGPIRSFSRLDIERLKRCEVQYYIASVLGIREFEEPEGGIKPDLIGQIVHTILNELYSGFEFLPGKIDLEFFEERLFKLFEKHFREGFFTGGEEKLLRRLQLDNLRQILVRDVERFREGFRVCNEYSEVELSGVIGRGSSLYTITGRIDRVDKSPSGGYCIIDYKTGSIPAEGEHFREGGFMQIQLGLYGILFRLNNPDARVESLNYFDINKEKDLVQIVGRDRIDEYLEEVEEHLLELLEGFNSKAKLGFADDPSTCVICPYHSICRVFER
jgi:RecB family exonuclease